MVTLDKYGAAIAFAHRCSQHTGGILRRPLIGIAHLRTGQLKYHGPALVLLGGSENGARKFVSQRPDVDRRNRESRDLAPSAGSVEILNRVRNCAKFQCRFMDERARSFASSGVGMENGIKHEAVKVSRGELACVINPNSAV